MGRRDLRKRGGGEHRSSRFSVPGTTAYHQRTSNNEGVKNHETESVDSLKASSALCREHHWRSRVPDPGDLLCDSWGLPCFLGPFPSSSGPKTGLYGRLSRPRGDLWRLFSPGPSRRTRVSSSGPILLPNDEPLRP